MQTNPYITVTGNVNKFDLDNRTFTMTPSQYIVLMHSTSALPIEAHFTDSNSKKDGVLKDQKSLLNPPSL